MSYAIGIDFGSTTSCVAVVRNGQVETIANDMGNRVTPSAIGFGDSEEALIGDPAVCAFAKNAKNTVVNAKRLLGINDIEDELCSEDIEAGYFSSKVVAGPDNEPLFEVQHLSETKQFSAEQITTMVLAKMKDTAEKFLGNKVEDAVIGIPAYFKSEEREALKRAAEAANLNVMRFINESSAVCMAHNFDNKSAPTENKNNSMKNIIVFDLGGTNFDASLVQADSNGFLSLKTKMSDSSLGGDKFNKKMLEFCRKDFKRKCKTTKDLLSEKGEFRILAQCESAKKTLSNSAQASIELDLLADDKDYSGSISRARFEELNEEYFNECLEVIDEMLDPEENDHGVVKHDITHVLLVGGSCKIPKVQELVRMHFGGCFEDSDNQHIQIEVVGAESAVLQDEAVAIGAAIQADLLMKNKLNDDRRIAKELKEASESSTKDTTAAENTEGNSKENSNSQNKLNILSSKAVQKATLSLNIGIADASNNFVPILTRGQVLPVSATHQFGASSTGAFLQIFEGMSTSCSENNRLCNAKLVSEKAMTVEFSVSLEGTLRVSKDGEVIAEVKREAAKPLAKEKVDEMVSNAGARRSVNEVNVSTYLAVEDLKMICQKIEYVILGGNQQQKQITEEQKSIIIKSRNILDSAINGELETEEIKERMEELKALTAEFCFW